MKICSKCKRPKDESEFHKRSNGKLSGHCKECQRAYCRQHYQNNVSAYVTKAREWNAKNQKLAQGYVTEYLSSHPCVDCGESDIIVLQFDHVRGKKKNSIANLMQSSWSLRAVKDEIEKCAVRCANCHLRKTAKVQGFWKVRAA